MLATPPSRGSGGVRAIESGEVEWRSPRWPSGRAGWLSVAARGSAEQAVSRRPRSRASGLEGVGGHRGARWLLASGSGWRSGRLRERATCPAALVSRHAYETYVAGRGPIWPRLAADEPSYRVCGLRAEMRRSAGCGLLATGAVVTVVSGKAAYTSPSASAIRTALWERWSSSREVLATGSCYAHEACVSGMRRAVGH